ncbi:hypothetical protein PILCRDRAFT_79797, partial [Piloderma croceum F 1598]
FVVFKGFIGLRHLEHVLKEPLCRLGAIVDVAPAGAGLAKKHSCPIYTTVPDMMTVINSGQLKVDGAILATPTSTHVPLGLLLVEAGVHVIIEKPLSVDTTSGKELVAAAASGAQILVGHHRRFNPYLREAYQYLKLINSEKLGQILAFQGVWSVLKPLSYFEIPWRREIGSGGPILTNLIHEIDCLRYLFGDIIRVYAEEGPKTRSHEVEETVACTFKFASGMVGTLVLTDAAASPFGWEAATGENPDIARTGLPCYTVLGTKGSITIPELTRFHYDSYPATEGHWLNDIESDTSLATSIDDVPPFTLQLKHFVDVIKGAAQPSCSGLEGLKNIIVLEAVEKSMRFQLPVFMSDA